MCTLIEGIAERLLGLGESKNPGLDWIFVKGKPKMS